MAEFMSFLSPRKSSVGRIRRRLAVNVLSLLGTVLAVHVYAATPNFFQIQVVDDQTGRGVPLVELETVNHLRFLTDSAGRIAFAEPGLMNQTVFFSVRSHGYEFPKDGFGFAGTRLETKEGQKAVVRIKRINIAERLYRITGQGIYRDSVLLGEPVPLRAPLGAGAVAGQDSTLAIPFQGKIFWFWGDTLRMKYPLGHFRTSGAVSDLSSGGGLNPSIGIDLQYFTDPDGFSRPMVPLEKNEGVVWIDGVLTVKDESGLDRLVAHYARRRGLGAILEQGLVAFNSQSNLFERVSTLPNSEEWRFPHGHPIRHRFGTEDYFVFGTCLPNVRVKANWQSILDPGAYEAWACVDSVAPPAFSRKPDGALQYRWRPDAMPGNAKLEREWIKTGNIKADEARFLPADVESGKQIQLHGGSVHWNPYRKKWIVVAVQEGGTSYLGEVWFGEAAEVTGPWTQVRKIVTHEKYSFYNPVHHDFFDQEGGRIIYFEGTYTETFSGNVHPTPLYDYNQIMYRLDLADPRLELAR